MSLAPPSVSPLVPGYRLDRYELLCPIADGGMAQVWIARLRGKHGFEKLVAIKSILPKYASDPQFQKMFLDEARIASGIEHTNVAQIFDLGDEHGVLYLAMEWVDGDALTKLHRALEKRGETIPMGVLLRILADTCGGLHAAHELRGRDGALLNVVHRDVSPQNILVSARGVAKLIDFGIAKARDRGAGETSTGFFKGKVQYMAPEQALGGPIDRRADVWAIGAILYHLVSGKPPYDGANQLATLHMLTSGKAPEPLPATVPPAVVAVILRALSVDRDKRYATAADLQAAIEEAMLSSQLSTTPSDVAAFTEKHLAERATNRHEAIDIALAAAEERARVEVLLKARDGDGSSPGVSRPRPVMTDSEHLLKTVPDVRPLSTDAKIPPPPSVPTAATLGLTVESSVEPLPMRSRRNVVIAAVGVVGVVLGVAGSIALRSGTTPPAAAVASPESPAVAVQVPPAQASERPPASPTELRSATGATDPPPSSATTRASAASPASPASPGSAAARAASPPPRSGPAATPRKIPRVIDNGF